MIKSIEEKIVIGKPKTEEVTQIVENMEVMGDDQFDEDQEDEEFRPNVGRVHKNQPIIKYHRARIFPKVIHQKNEYTQVRSDFRSTIFWDGLVEVDRNGESKIEFYTSDAITSFKATIEGIGAKGLVGRTEKLFYNQLPFSMSIKTPVEVVTEDQLKIPLTLKNNTNRILSGELDIKHPKSFKLIHAPMHAQTLKAGESKTIYLEYNVLNNVGTEELNVKFQANGLSDAFVQSIKTVSKGFPTTYSFSGSEKNAEYTIDLQKVVKGSISAQLTAFPSVTSDLISGVNGILREPSGCFEQTSMSSYPNILVMDYLKTIETKDEQLLASAEGMIDRGYKRLLTFETNTKGYEWFGSSPGHEGLTAYGLMQFNDMKNVYNVDQKMIDRTANWILSKRDGKGKFSRNTQRELHDFGRINEDVMNGYIVYALTDAGYKELHQEFEYTYKNALVKKDPYLLAMATNAAFNYGDEKRGNTTMEQLLSMQEEDGSWKGTTHSITHSTGHSLIIETTSIAIMAMLKSKRVNKGVINKAVQYLVNNRSGYGSFGNTQGTILALKALTAYAKASKRTSEDGIIQFFVDGEKVSEKAYKAGDTDAIVFDNLGQFITTGKQQLKVKYVGVENPLPYSLAVSYNTTLPQSSEECTLLMETSLINHKVKVGETVRFKAKIINTTENAIPCTMAIIGIPAGTSLQPWQLKELRDKNNFAFYEINGNKLVIYYRGMTANETKEINLDLKAEIPGEFEAAASSSYLYYTNEHKNWVSGESIKIYR